MSRSIPQTSIIMRSKNSDWVIDQALAALYSQCYRDFELLVVDSGSTDRTIEIVKQYPCRLIEIAPEEYYPGPVLNNAIEQTKGEYVVFQNSDTVPLAPQTLGRLLSAFDDDHVQAAFCRQTPRPDAHRWVRRDYTTAFPQEGTAPEWLPYSLPMAAMRRTAWQEHPFYTAAWGSEDTEWGQWARENGCLVRYMADAVVMHSHNYTLKQLYGRKFIEGEADAFIYGKRYPLGGALARILRHTARDLRDAIAVQDWNDLVASSVRNAVSGWAHYRGARLGNRRMEKGNSDTSIGQGVVLSAT